METVLIIAGIILIVTGIIGSIVPVLPGPPISFLALLLMQLSDKYAFSWRFILIWALITLVVTVLDYIIPSYGTKRYGGSREGIIGCFIGVIAGLFFAPVGLIVGPVIGAWLGEIVSGKDFRSAIRPAIGSFIGFLVGTVLKLVAASMMAYYFFANL